jgi:hypothetical protein
MLKRIGARVTYANVTATVALFVALGGGAVALEGRNSVNSGDIKEGAVKSADLKNDGVKARDLAPGAIGTAEVADGALLGGDLASDSLTGAQIDEASLDVGTLPGTGGLASRIRNIGTGGETLYGGPSGDTTANASMDVVQMVGHAGLGMDLEGMVVHLDSAPGAGESRTISVVRRAVPDSSELPTSLSCTLEEGERFCLVEDTWSINTNLFAIKIENVGAGLPAGDEAYVGLAVGG